MRILGLCTIEDVMEEIIGEEVRPAQYSRRSRGDRARVMEEIIGEEVRPTQYSERIRRSWGDRAISRDLG